MQQTVKVLTKSVLGFGLVLALAGCSLPSRPQQIEISAKPLTKPALNLPPVDELNLRPVEWVIINEANLETKLNELRGKGPLAMFVLTGEGYENLGLNFSDIRALVQQQQQIIIAYENYYKAAEAAMENAVTTE
jgi:hypothetical protein